MSVRMIMRFLVSLFLIFSCLLASRGSYGMPSNNTSTLYFVAFVPYINGGGKILPDHFGYKGAIQMAVDLVNNRTDILPNYKIDMKFTDTFGSAGYSQKRFIDHVLKGPAKIGILGPAYSVAAYPVAQLASLYQVPQILYASLLPELVNHNRYPFLFRTSPSQISFNEAKLAVLKHFNWRRVGIIYDYANTLNFQSIDHLQKLLKKNGFEVIAIEGFSTDFGASSANEVKKMKDLDARIIITELSIKGARSVFCEAYKQNMIGEKYVWFTSASLGTTWYRTLTDTQTCSTAQLRAAVDGHFYVTRMDLRNDEKKTVSGMTSEEFFSALKQKVPHASSFASFAFDAVWIFAKSLHIMAKNHNLTEYRYSNPRFNYLVYARTMMQSNFEAISGPLQFTENSERMGNVMFGQFLNDTRRHTALHSSTTGNLSFYPGRREELFNGKPPPLDHTVQIYIAKTLSASVIAVMWSFAGFGLIISCFFLYFNIKYRENRLIKMSSPMINNIIIIGSILCYIAVILYGLDSRLIKKMYIPRMCNVFVWVLTIGFTLSFGALFSKTWRVYKIFTAAKSMERVAILDRHLFGIIFLLLGIDAILLTIWMVLSPYNMKITELSRVGNVLRDVIEVTQVYHCSAKFGLYFSSSAIAYKGILLFFGLFLAWETRKVEVLALNDSKFIGMAVYNVAAISAIGVTCTYALSDADSYEASFTIVCLCIILCTTVTLCLVFVPKLTLLFSKESAMATETSKFSTLKSRPASSIAVKAQSSNSNASNGGTFGSQQHSKVSVTTLASYTSTPNESGFLNSLDTRAWSASMSELSKNCKSEDDLGPERKTSSTLPHSVKKAAATTQGLSFKNRVFGKSDSICEQPGNETDVLDSSMNIDVTQNISNSPLPNDFSESPLGDDGKGENSFLANHQCNGGFSCEDEFGSSVEMNSHLPNGIPSESFNESDTVPREVTPRVVPTSHDAAIFKRGKENSDCNDHNDHNDCNG